MRIADRFKSFRMQKHATTNNIVDRMESAEASGRDRFNSFTRADRLDTLSTNTGTLVADALVSPAADVTSIEPTNSTFTGVAMGGEGWTFGSTVYHFVAVASGALQAGFNYLGKLIAGAGAVTLDADGVSLLADSAITDPSAIKFVDSGGNIITYTGSYYDASTVTHSVNSYGSVVTKNARTYLQASAPNTKSATVYLEAQSDQVVNIRLTSDPAGTHAVDFNPSSVDTDTRIYGTSATPIATFDAGLDAMGVGGAAESGKKLKVTGDTSLDGAVIINDSGADKDTIIEGDTNANLVHVDASADAVGIGGAADFGGAYALKVTGLQNVTASMVIDNALVVNEAGIAGGNFRAESDGDTHNIFSDATNNRVGIGTASPATKLDVNGQISTAGITSSGFFNLGAAGALTIASDAVTATKSYHTIDTEGGAATDNLATINGGTVGDILILRTTNNARDVTVKDGTGNIALAGDFLMDTIQDTITLLYNGTTWLEIARSNNA